MCSQFCVSIRHPGLSRGVRARRELPCPGLSPHHSHTSTWHRPTGTGDMEGRGSLVREQEEKGEMPPWLLLCCWHSRWISGKRIQEIPIWNSLAPRTFPYQSENPPCYAPSVRNFRLNLQCPLSSQVPGHGFAIDYQMALHPGGTFTVVLEFIVSSFVIKQR